MAIWRSGQNKILFNNDGNEMNTTITVLRRVCVPVGDEIPRPAMTDLVGDHEGQRLVTGLPGTNRRRDQQKGESDEGGREGRR